MMSEMFEQRNSSGGETPVLDHRRDSVVVEVKTAVVEETAKQREEVRTPGSASSLEKGEIIEVSEQPEGISSPGVPEIKETQSETCEPYEVEDGEILEIKEHLTQVPNGEPVDELRTLRPFEAGEVADGDEMPQRTPVEGPETMDVPAITVTVAKTEQQRRSSEQHQTMTLPSGHKVQILDNWIAARDGRDWTAPPVRPETPKRTPATFKGAKTLDSWIAERDGRDWRPLLPRYPASPSSRPEKRVRGHYDSSATRRTKEPWRPSPEYGRYAGPTYASAPPARGDPRDAGRKRRRSPSLDLTAQRPAKRAGTDVDWSAARRDARRDGADAFGIAPEVRRRTAVAAAAAPKPQRRMKEGRREGEEQR